MDRVALKSVDTVSMHAATIVPEFTESTVCSKKSFNRNTAKSGKDRYVNS